MIKRRAIRRHKPIIGSINKVVLSRFRFNIIEICTNNSLLHHQWTFFDIVSNTIIEHEIDLIRISFNEGIIGTSNTNIKKTAKTLKLVVVSLYIKVNFGIGKGESVVVALQIEKKLTIDNMNIISVTCNIEESILFGKTEVIFWDFMNHWNVIGKMIVK